MHRRALAHVRKPDFTFESIRRENYYEDRVRTRLVYGNKVVQPNAVAVIKRNS